MCSLFPDRVAFISSIFFLQPKAVCLNRAVRVKAMAKKFYLLCYTGSLKTVTELCWCTLRCRSDSFITDKFHGQYRAVTTCPSCSFSSRKFESFTILQLGLPQPKTREVNFLLIDVGGNSAPRNMKVDVPGEGTVKDMYYVVANFLGENDPEPWTVMALGQKRGEGEVAIKSPDEKLSNFL